MEASCKNLKRRRMSHVVGYSDAAALCCRSGLRAAAAFLSWGPCDARARPCFCNSNSQEPGSTMQERGSEDGGGCLMALFG